MASPKSYAEAVTPRSREGDLIWNWDLCMCSHKGQATRTGPNPVRLCPYKNGKLETDP